MITLPACIFILVEIWFLRNMQGDESFFINLIVMLTPLGMACFYLHAVFSYLRKVDSGHLTDTIIIDERGIRQESRKGENKFVAWDEIDNIRRLTCHRSPPIISVTAAGSGGTHMAAGRSNTYKANTRRFQSPSRKPGRTGAKAGMQAKRRNSQ